MIPILTAAAVVSPVQLPAEGAAEAAVPKSPENAFGTAVERAFAKGGPDARQGAKAQPPEEAEGRKAGTDPAASAWAAGWVLQPTRLAPLAQEQTVQAASPALSLSAAANPAGATNIPDATSSPVIQFGATGYPAGAMATPGSAINPAISFGATGYPAGAMASSNSTVSSATLFGTAGTFAGAMATPSATVNPSIPFGAARYPADGTTSLSAAISPAIPFGEAGYPASAMSSLGAASPAGAMISSSATVGMANVVNPLGAAGNPTSRPVPQGAANFADMARPERMVKDLGNTAALSDSVVLPDPAAPSGVANPANTRLQGNRANLARAAEGSMAIPADAPSVPTDKVLSVDARAASVGLADARIVSQQSPTGERTAPLEQAHAGRTAFTDKVVARQAEDGTTSTAVAEFKATPELKDATVSESGDRPEEAARPGIAGTTKQEVLPELRAAKPAMRALPEALSESRPGAAVNAAPAQQPAVTAGAAAPKPEALPSAASALQVAQDVGADLAEPAAEGGSVAEPKASGREMAASPGADAARAGSAQAEGEAAQTAGQYARVQAVARQETAVNPQPFEAEPERERTPQTAGVKRPEGDPAGAPGAVWTAHAGQGAPRTEQTGAAAPTDAPRSTFEPNAAMQLARATAGALSRGEREFRLRLRPEGMGEVAVTISARDRDLHLTIRAASESTRDLILNQIGGLREELTAGGYHLNGFSVDVSGGGGQGGQTFTFQQDPGRQSGQRPEARPEARPGGAPPPKEAPRAGAPEARAGAINYRI